MIYYAFSLYSFLCYLINLVMRNQLLAPSHLILTWLKVVMFFDAINVLPH